jgi:hypothetical protein
MHAYKPVTQAAEMGRLQFETTPGEKLARSQVKKRTGCGSTCFLSQLPRRQREEDHHSKAKERPYLKND